MLQKLWVKGFRNLKEVVFDFNDYRAIFLYGENNQGKSNFLEAIYFLGNLKSPKEQNLKNMINFQAKEALLGGDFSLDSKILRLYTKINHENQKYLLINQKNVKKVSEVKKYLLIEYLSIENLRYFLDSPEYRRKSLDNALISFVPEFLAITRKYERIIKQKNHLLKQKNNLDQITIWNQELVILSHKIAQYRINFLTQLKQELTPIIKNFQKISHFSFDFQYLFSGEAVNEVDYLEYLKQKLVQNLDKELKLGYSLYGAHRDDFHFFLNNHEIHHFYSRGINILFAILYRITQLMLLQNKTKLFPILLLDDIFSELDAEIKQGIVNLIEPKTQVFYTAINQTDQNLFSNPLVFNVNNGELINV